MKSLFRIVIGSFVLRPALSQEPKIGLVVNPKNSPGARGSVRSVPIDISGLRDNRAFAKEPDDANFDGTGAGYPAQFLPPEDFTYGGVDFIFPQYESNNGNDNVLAMGQTLNITKGRYIGLHILAAAEMVITEGFVKATYADGSTSSFPVVVGPFWAWPTTWWPYQYGADIIFPYHLTNETVNYNRSMIFRTINWLDSSKELTSLMLPNVRTGATNRTGGGSQEARLHVFAVSLISADTKGMDLKIQLARSTNTWFEGTNKTQIFEASILNVGTEWVLANQSTAVTVNADGVRTVHPGHINRLRPGDEARVQIGVVNMDGVVEGTKGTATLVISGTGVSANYTFNATYGIRDFEPTYEDVYAHESPPWFSNAKYGIMIHWGLFSVPGWGNSGDNESYAEWYWWWMNQGPNSTRERTYEYHLETYGSSVVFDDFIAGFTASAFDPKGWVGLFADAGAKYFVQVAKQHDGYALFDLPANVTKRTSVAQFPRRNLLQEIFDAARKYQPQLRRASYYSLPEWFHPDYHGFGDWPGGNATNPYTNKTLAYTGYVPVADYVTDKILPEMKALAEMGTEIMWCDIGGPNLTIEFAAEYFNNAAKLGKQVLINNRCGIPGDFDTARYDSVQTRKWESSQSLDPYSYGYNRATPEDKYLAPQGIVTRLIDTVSKNGNFLLNVGPTANGTITDVAQRNLRQAGAWIKSHAEAIFDTTYWSITAEEGEAIRFTQTLDAFYIIALSPPNDTIVLKSPIPYVEGDEVTVLGGNLSGAVIPCSLSNGILSLTISEEVRDADEYSWVFKISYRGPIARAERGVVGVGLDYGTTVALVDNISSSPAIPDHPLGV